MTEDHFLRMCHKMDKKTFTPLRSNVDTRKLFILLKKQASSTLETLMTECTRIQKSLS